MQEPKPSQCESFLMLSGHDYRSKRKANVHFIMREFSKLGKARFFSSGFSYLSVVKKDPRLSLWNLANKVEQKDGVECYLWRSVWHPINLRCRLLSWLEPMLFRYYVRSVPTVLKQWIAEADTIVLESGMPVIFYDIIYEVNPQARVLYLCSDALDTIGCASYLSEKLQQVAPKLSGIRIPSPKLVGEFPKGAHLYYIPHGMDVQNVNTDAPSPYGEGIHAVSVGSMLFDASFFDIAAEAFPHITFHVIGGGRKADVLRAPNIKIYGEMPFQDTLAYIRHAQFGIAPYEGKKVSSYLVDTSMKLMQFGAFGLPAVCPFTAAGDKKGRFGYEPGNRESIVSAINAALACGQFTGGAVLSWADVAQRILHPEIYTDTYLAPERS